MALNMPDPNREVGDSGHTSDTNLIIEAVNTLKSAVDNIPAGPQGPQGEPGTPGAAGANASVTVGSTTTGAAGSNAAVTNSGTEQNAVFNFTIPRGEKGDTGAAGSQGTQGPKGDTGDAGATGAGVKPGGVEGQVLQKLSSTDFDTTWVFPGNAPVTSVDGRQGAVTLDDLYDAAGAAAAAQTAAEDYADGLAVNYDSAGAASAAQTAAEGYADSLAVNYDAAGSAAQALSDAEDYADGLAVNYDAAGSASAVAGDLTDHENATTNVHGITNTADLVVTTDSRLSDARTPTDGSVTDAKIVAGGLSTTAITGTAVVTGDARLSDQRTPLDNSVTSAKIVDGTIVNADVSATAAVEFSKLENGSSLSVLGRSANSSGAVASIAAGSNHTVLRRHNSVLEFGTVDAQFLSNDSVTSAKIHDGAVTSAKIANGTIVDADVNAAAAIAPSKINGTAVVTNDVHLITFVTSSTRPVSPTEGMIIYETDTNLYYGWKGSAWSPIGGGATGGGTDDVFYENAQTVTTSYTLTTNKNAMTAGPVTINSGATVTVPSGSNWVVV